MKYKFNIVFSVFLSLDKNLIKLEKQSKHLFNNKFLTIHQTYVHYLLCFFNWGNSLKFTKKKVIFVKAIEFICLVAAFIVNYFSFIKYWITQINFNKKGWIYSCVLSWNLAEASVIKNWRVQNDDICLESLVSLYGQTLFWIPCSGK